MSEAHGIMILVLGGNEFNDPSSNPGQSCLHFTFAIMPLKKKKKKKKTRIPLFSPQLWVIERADWVL